MHMNKKSLQKTLNRAEEKCLEAGVRLTDKRRQILTILLQSSTPLSAYEIADQYNMTAEKSIPPMSAYRILDFLLSEKLAHKLESTNKYVACSHITCDHSHEISQFLICHECNQVKELRMHREILNQIKTCVEEAGYHMRNHHLELNCVCDQCFQNKNTH